MSPTSTKNILVSGAAGNLGRVVVKMALEAGHSVVSLCRSPYEEKVLIDFLSASKLEKHMTLIGDLNTSSTVADHVAKAASTLGSIDAFLGLAGGFRYAPVQETCEEDFDFLFASNMRSAWLLTKQITAYMQGQNYGRIIMMSARATQGIGEEGLSLYLASKAALNAYLACLQREIRTKNITINTILATIIDTAANRDSMPDADPSNWVAPEAIAALIFTLLDDNCSALNGALLTVPGKL